MPNAFFVAHRLGRDLTKRGKEGDIHDTGANLVCSFLEGAGFEIVDLGVNVEPQQFVEAIKREGV